MSKVGNSMDSYGVKILMAEIKQLDLPEDNKAAVYERMISERNQIAASYQAEGDSEAKKIRNSTDKEISCVANNNKTTAPVFYFLPDATMQVQLKKKKNRRTSWKTDHVFSKVWTRLRQNWHQKFV